MLDYWEASKNIRIRFGEFDFHGVLSKYTLYLSPKPLNNLRILQTGFRERPLLPEASEPSV